MHINNVVHMHMHNPQKHNPGELEYHTNKVRRGETVEVF